MTINEDIVRIEDVVNEDIESFIHCNVDPSYVLAFVKTLFSWLRKMECQYLIENTAIDVDWTYVENQLVGTFKVEVPQRYDVELSEGCIMAILDEMKSIV